MAFSTIDDVFETFPNEEVCLQYLEKLLWNGIPVSPFALNSKVYFCKGNKYKCRETGLYFNVKTNTIFHNSKISLNKWFAAIWLLAAKESAITSVELAKQLGITQKTSWYMMQRIASHFSLKKQRPQKKAKSLPKNPTIEKIEVVLDADKLKMIEWLKLLKK